MDNKKPKVSKAQQKAVHEYVRRNYDRINVTLKKGEKDLIKEHAATYSESINAFVVRAIHETMQRDDETAAEQ